MKNKTTTRGELNIKLVLISIIHTILFALEVAGAMLLYFGSTVLGWSLLAPPAILELAYGIAIMVQSAKKEHNDGYLTTAGSMYLCPLAQLVGVYFHLRYFIDKVNQAEIDFERKEAIKLKNKKETTKLKKKEG